MLFGEEEKATVNTSAGVNTKTKDKVNRCVVTSHSTHNVITIKINLICTQFGTVRFYFMRSINTRQQIEPDVFGVAVNGSIYKVV